MKKITITGWHKGFNKVKFNKFLRDRCGYGLAEAHKAVARILDDQSEEIIFPSFSKSDEDKLSDLGAKYIICE